jgi:hypothetical protein
MAYSIYVDGLSNSNDFYYVPDANSMDEALGMLWSATHDTFLALAEDSEYGGDKLLFIVVSISDGSVVKDQVYKSISELQRLSEGSHCRPVVTGRGYCCVIDDVK